MVNWKNCMACGTVGKIGPHRNVESSADRVKNWADCSCCKGTGFLNTGPSHAPGDWGSDEEVCQYHLLKLPRRAIVGFSVRSAKRAYPVFVRWRSSASHESVVLNAIDQAMGYTHGGVARADESEVIAIAREAGDDGEPLIAAAVTAAAQAVMAAQSAIGLAKANGAAWHAETAGQEATKALGRTHGAIEAARWDLEWLLAIYASDLAGDSFPFVPLAFFSRPLWLRWMSRGVNGRP